VNVNQHSAEWGQDLKNCSQRAETVVHSSLVAGAPDGTVFVTLAHSSLAAGAPDGTVLGL
jgi:hypothetical protein